MKMHTFDCFLLIVLPYDGDFLYFRLMVSYWILFLFHCLQHIAKQRMPGLPDDLMKKGKHIILIRSPLDILVSYVDFC